MKPAKLPSGCASRVREHRQPPIPSPKIHGRCSCGCWGCGSLPQPN